MIPCIQICMRNMYEPPEIYVCACVYVYVSVDVCMSLLVCLCVGVSVCVCVSECMDLWVCVFPMYLFPFYFFRCVTNVT